MCFSRSWYSWRLVPLSVGAPLPLCLPEKPVGATSANSHSLSLLPCSFLRSGSATVMLHHISAACWWHGPTSDRAAPLQGQKLPQLVLPARGVLVKPWCDLCCGELEHENGLQQNQGWIWLDWSDSFFRLTKIFRKYWLSFTYYLVWNCRSYLLVATKGGNYFNSALLPEARDYDLCDDGLSGYLFSPQVLGWNCRGWSVGDLLHNVLFFWC